MRMTYATHEQAMACLSCGLAGAVPESHFPLEPGLWERPCPRCSAMSVWVTEVRAREEADATGSGPTGAGQ